MLLKQKLYNSYKILNINITIFKITDYNKLQHEISTYNIN